MSHVTLTLRGPYMDRDASWHLRTWGAPPAWDYESLPTAVHHRDGGLHVFYLPPVPDLLRYARKAAKHPSAATALDLLAREPQNYRAARACLAAELAKPANASDIRVQAVGHRQPCVEHQRHGVSRVRV